MILSLKTVKFEAHNPTTNGWTLYSHVGVRRVDFIDNALMLTLHDNSREMFGWVRNLRVS